VDGAGVLRQGLPAGGSLGPNKAYLFLFMPFLSERCWPDVDGAGVLRQGLLAGGSLGTETRIKCINRTYDLVCLQDAVERGWLRESRSCVSGSVNLLAVLATAPKTQNTPNAAIFRHQNRVKYI
jgi:hypothetical protein